MVCFVSDEVIKNYKLNNRSIPNRFYSIHGKSKEKLEKFIVILSQKRTARNRENTTNASICFVIW